MMNCRPNTNYLKHYLSVCKKLIGADQAEYAQTVDYISDAVQMLEGEYGENVSNNVGRRNFRALEFMIIGILATLPNSPVVLDRPLVDVEKSLYYKWQVENYKRKKVN